MIETWTCEQTATTTEECIVTSSSTPFVAVSYHDWLFVSIIVIFMLSFIVWGYLWSPFKKQ